MAIKQIGAVLLLLLQMTLAHKVLTINDIHLDVNST